MSKILDNIRSLRDAVVRPIGEGCKGDGETGGHTKWQGKSFPVRKKRGKKRKAIPESFDVWIERVEEAVDNICGMDIDILDGTDWESMYEQGILPVRAAQIALEDAENEDEDGDEGEELQEFSLGKMNYKQWATKLDKKIRKVGDTTLIAAKKAANITNPVLHSMFMSQTTIEMAARMIMRAAGVATEDRQPRSSLRRRSSPVYEEEFEDELEDMQEEFNEPDVKRNPLDALIEEFSVRVKPRVKPKPYNEVMKYMDEFDLGESRAPLSPTPMAKRGLPLAPSERPQAVTQPTQPQDMMAAAFSSVQGVVAEERAAKQDFEKQQKLRQQQDEDARARIQAEGEGQDEEELDEASVMGGDYGRWAPATSAAGSGGRGLASAISKATGMKYKFEPDGDPASAEVGSDLWFSIEPNKAGADIYYLGIKIKGDKESPMWDVMLKKGKGLGTATSIASKRGVETSGLKSAVASLKSGVSQSKAPEGGEE